MNIVCVFLLNLIACTGGNQKGMERIESNPTSLQPKYEYQLKDVHAVNGRQGVCSEGDYYWVSGSTTLTKTVPSGQYVTV